MPIYGGFMGMVGSIGQREAVLFLFLYVEEVLDVFDKLKTLEEIVEKVVALPRRGENTHKSSRLYQLPNRSIKSGTSMVLR